MAASPRPLRTKAAKSAAQATTAGRLDQGHSVPLPPATLEALDAWARRSGLSRAQAARLLIETALRRFENYTATEGPA